MKVLAEGRVAKLLLIFILCSALAFISSCSAPHPVPKPQCAAMPPLTVDLHNNVILLSPVACAGSMTFTIAPRTGMIPCSPR